MADNKQNIGEKDWNKINLSEEYEVHDWSEKFVRTRDELIQSVKKI